MQNLFAFHNYEYRGRVVASEVSPHTGGLHLWLLHSDGDVKGYKPDEHKGFAFVTVDQLVPVLPSTIERIRSEIARHKAATSEASNEYAKGLETALGLMGFK